MADHQAHRRHHNHNKRFSSSRPAAQSRKRRRTSASHQSSKGHLQVAAQLPVCCVCVDSNNKPPSYKCPKCRALYCSVACCKEHKNVCPGKPPEESTVDVKPSSHPPPQAMSRSRPKPRTGTRRKYNGGDDDDDDDNDLDDGWKVTDEMKKAIENSQWLRNQLQDGGLREVIRQVVASGEGLEQQQPQHRFPQFQVFIDKLLVVAGVLEREADTDEPLEEWLEQDWGHDPPPLSLRPWRRQLPTFPPVDVSSSDIDDDEENSDDSSDEKDEGKEEDESSASTAPSSTPENDTHQSDEGEEHD